MAADLDDDDKALVPFDEFGNLLRAAWTPEGEIVWRAPEPFTARLQLGQFARGRAAGYVMWLDDESHMFPMSMTEFVETVRTVGVEPGGYAEAEWIAHRRGGAYGIQLYMSRRERRMVRRGSA
ncbi:hypothetical protein [Nonomuraea sp. NEAU-A123]|uniref:hypothetical protein n=1 Tax=Nonomuraea sp. NEAU-A123 TaxID=2839649 RepID=UPI001BE3ECBB|nr:hypothetical protein [Nonomuraea sp. NEAU-A123]MBT2234791.1 hypothetical protein [Nonomuraea sp. NEAU-A123]